MDQHWHIPLVRASIVLSCLVLACLVLSWPVLAPFSSSNLAFHEGFHKNSLSRLTSISRRVFGGILAPFWEVKSTKILLKVDPKRHQSSDRFLGRYLVDLGSDFGRQDEPKTGPRGRQDRQDGPKRPPRRPKRPPRWPQEGPKKPSAILIFRYWPPSASKDPPGPLQD